MPTQQLLAQLVEAGPGRALDAVWRLSMASAWKGPDKVGHYIRRGLVDGQLLEANLNPPDRPCEALGYDRCPHCGEELFVPTWGFDIAIGDDLPITGQGYPTREAAAAEVDRILTERGVWLDACG